MQSIKTYLYRLLRYIRKGQPIVVVKPEIAVLGANNMLANRLALITGGTSGIGKAIVIAFLNSGADVIFTSRNESRASLIAKDLLEKFPDRFVLGIAMDNRDVSSMKASLQILFQRLDGRQIDILVNNAGLSGGMWGCCTEKEYDDVMDTNLKAAFFLSDFVAQNMIIHQAKGNILNICSSSSIRPANSAYCLSKWGLRGLTEGLAKMLTKHGIVVNGIAPGPTATPMLNSNANDIVRPNSPIGRLILPEEIANMAVFLVSSMGSSIIGDIVYMTGGAGIITLDDIAY